MTQAQIAAARALCDAATPGPWGVVTGWDVETDWYTYDAVGPHCHEDDAEFIAQARTLLRGHRRRTWRALVTLRACCGVTWRGDLPCFVCDGPGRPYCELTLAEMRDLAAPPGAS